MADPIDTATDATQARAAALSTEFLVELIAEDRDDMPIYLAAAVKQAGLDRALAESTEASLHEQIAAHEATIATLDERVIAELERNRALDSEVATLRARVAELEARPVLTEDMVASALLVSHGGGAGREFVAAFMRHLGAVTLPAQDRADDLFAAFRQEMDAITDESWAMRRALASLGAPEKSPPAPQADVFAAVSVEELVQVSADAYVTAKDAPGTASIRAVLDALRVKLVAPVDPEVVAVRFVDAGCYAGEWDKYGEEWQIKRIAAMRAALVAEGVPVTPEVSKIQPYAGPPAPPRVLVHADGGDCHGWRIVDGRCSKCGTAPDTQSTELWPPKDAKPSDPFARPAPEVSK